MSYISYLIKNKPDYEIEIYEYLLNLKPVAHGGTTNSISKCEISDKAARLILDTAHNSLLKALSNNPHLSQSIVEELARLGHTPTLVTTDKSATPIQFDPTSALFPFIESSKWKDQSMAGVRSLEPVLPHITNAIYALGHPYSILDNDANLFEPRINEESLNWIIQREYLHRIFWRELSISCEGFTPAFRAQDQITVLFINHNILASQFNYIDLEVNPIIGGSIDTYPERDWLRTTRTIPEEEYPDEEEYSVEINLDFPEKLSWGNLQREKQDQLFSLLGVGMQSSAPRLSADAEHFLACMALHPATPQELLSRLAALNSEMISNTLDARN